MPRTYPLEIALDEFSDERIDAVIGEIEEAVENIRKYHGGDAKHIEDVDIDELLAVHGSAAVIWTADDIREVVPHLDETRSPSRHRRVFPHFLTRRDSQPRDDPSDRPAALPLLTRKERSQRADKAIHGYASGDARENLVDFLADAIHWCDDLGEPFDEFYQTAKVHHSEERNSERIGDQP